MASRSTLPFGIIVMILMMALAVLGVGYAWWSEQLVSTTTIQTGSIQVILDEITIVEDDDLDVGSCSSKISSDGKIITVLVGNSYPSYSCRITFKLTNTGSVPARLAGISMPGNNDEYRIEATGALVDRPVLNPSAPREAAFFIQIRPGASQDSSYRFDIRLDVQQGNAP
jgi:predicted ribosomally synthesized peptide with SipW-like signal peptide